LDLAKTFKVRLSPSWCKILWSGSVSKSRTGWMGQSLLGALQKKLRVELAEIFRQSLTQRT